MKYSIVSLLIFITDGILKGKVEKQMKAGQVLPVLRGKVHITKFHNTGAMLSIGKNKQKQVVGLAILFTAFMTGIFVATLGYKGKHVLKFGLSLLLGGAYSNTYDRLMRKYVVDYISFQTKHTKLKYVIFNLSDFMIIIGALIMVIYGFVEEK